MSAQTEEAAPTETLEKVRSIIAKQVGVPLEKVQRDTKLEELGDSLDLVEAVFALEVEFGIDIPLNPQDQKQRLETVDDVVKAVERMMAERDAG